MKPPEEAEQAQAAMEYRGLFLPPKASVAIVTVGGGMADEVPQPCLPDSLVNGPEWTQRQYVEGGLPLAIPNDGVGADRVMTAVWILADAMEGDPAFAELNAGSAHPPVMGSFRPCDLHGGHVMLAVLGAATLAFFERGDTRSVHVDVICEGEERAAEVEGLVDRALEKVGGPILAVMTSSTEELYEVFKGDDEDE